MKKPTAIQGYNETVTDACERVLVTLFRHLGPWRDSIFLVGGLTPRYLIKERPPAVPAHAGTGDVEVVVDMKLLADTEAYRTLEDNIRVIGFTRSENDKGQKLSWRWQQELVDGTVLILEFLTDGGDEKGGALQELPSEGAVSAIRIPHSAMVLDHHEAVEITAELLGDGGVTTETTSMPTLSVSPVSRPSRLISAASSRMPTISVIALSTTRTDRMHCNRRLRQRWTATMQ